MADTNTVHVGTTHPMTPPHTYEVRLVRVEEDVKGLKSDIGEIKSGMSTGFKEIGEQLKSKGQPNWAALAIVAGLLVPALGWGWSQLGNIQQHAETALSDTKLTFAQAIAKQEAALTAAAAEQKAALAAATAKQDAFMKREDIVALNASAKEIADLKMQIVQKDVTRLGDDVKVLQGQIVPLSTHQELWAKQSDTNKGLAAGIDENRKSLADITAPRDTISRIDRRLEELERARRTGRAD